MLVTLICPECRAGLKAREDSFQCSGCGKIYRRRRGVLSFLESEEDFNEGEYDDYQKRNWSRSALLRERISRSGFLSLLNRIRIRCSMSGRRDRLFADAMRRGDRNAVIMDLGCGGGRHYFCEYGKVVGVDPVLELLLNARQIYDEVYHCGGFALPFADESFDYVVSTDVIGHIHARDKDRLFREMHRVLKMGGRAVHVIETDATNRWFEFAHRYPDLFQKHFVDRPGHFGLELPTRLRERFLKHGFKEIAFRKVGSNLPEVGFFGWFDNEYKFKSRRIRFRVGLDRLLSRNLVVSELANVILEPIAALNDRLTPLDYGCGALVVYEK